MRRRLPCRQVPRGGGRGQTNTQVPPRAWRDLRTAFAVPAELVPPRAPAVLTEQTQLARRPSFEGSAPSSHRGESSPLPVKPPPSDQHSLIDSPGPESSSLAEDPAPFRGTEITVTSPKNRRGASPGFGGAYGFLADI